MDYSFWTKYQTVYRRKSQGFFFSFFKKISYACSGGRAHILSLKYFTEEVEDGLLAYASHSTSAAAAAAVVADLTPLAESSFSIPSKARTGLTLPKLQYLIFAAGTAIRGMRCGQGPGSGT